MQNSSCFHQKQSFFRNTSCHCPWHWHSFSQLIFSSSLEAVELSLPHLLLVLIAFCRPLGFSLQHSLKSYSFICVYCAFQSLISQFNSVPSKVTSQDQFIFILLLQFISKIRVPKSAFYRFFEDQDREAVSMWYLPLLSHLFTNQCQAPKFIHSLLYKKRNSVIQYQNRQKCSIWQAWIQAWHFWLRCQCRCLSSDYICLWTP